MYITTMSDSVIPVTNIKAIKPAEGGCVIHLKTGERVKDPRKNTEVLQQAYQDRIEVGPLIDAITTMATCISVHQNNIDTQLKDLNTKVHSATFMIEGSAKELDKSAQKLSNSSNRARGSAKILETITETLNVAIQEI